MNKFMLGLLLGLLSLLSVIIINGFSGQSEVTPVTAPVEPLVEQISESNSTVESIENNSKREILEAAGRIPQRQSLPFSNQPFSNEVIVVPSIGVSDSTTSVTSEATEITTFQETNNSPSLLVRFLNTFEVFSATEIIIYSIMLIALLFILFIKSEDIEKDTNKKYLWIVSSAIICILSVIYYEFAQSKHQRVNETADNSVDFSSIIYFILQESEGLPYPLNDPSVLLRIFAYVILASITLSISLWILTSTVKALTGNAFDSEYAKQKRDENKDDEKPRISVNTAREYDEKSIKNFEKLEKYYIINMSQTVKSFWLSFLLIATGFIIIVSTICAAIILPELEISVAIIAGISGVFLEFIGGTALLLYNKNIQYFNRFFDVLVRNQDTTLAVSLSKDLEKIKGSFTSEYTKATRTVISHLVSRESIPNSLLESSEHAENNGKKSDAKKK